jgi:hypothetical protein
VGQRVFAIISAGIAAALIATASLAQAAGSETKPLPPVPWKKVPDTEKKVLNPLQKDWDQLPSGQQRKLVGAAKAYPKLAPIQQERFQERIKDWSQLTPEQRRAARDKYKDLSSLPPEQHTLRERWNEKSAHSDGSGTPASATDSTATAK